MEIENGGGGEVPPLLKPWTEGLVFRSIPFDFFLDVRNMSNIGVSYSSYYSISSARGW